MQSLSSPNSTSLHQLNTHYMHHNQNHPTPNHFSISASHHPFNSSPNHHHQNQLHHELSDLLNHLEISKSNQIPFPLPLPNFLIDPQDGQFTPYFDRSPASSPGQEYDNPMDFFHHNSQPSSPSIPITPLRSRATSIALKKLIEIQAQRLLDISAAWKKKYPAEEVEFASDKHSDPNLSSPPSNQEESVDVIHQEQGIHKEQTHHALSFQFSCETLQKPVSITRHHAFLSQRSTSSLASSVDRLSLNDYHSLRKDQRTPQKIDLDKWKREVLESKLKLESTRNWISSLPLPTDFDSLQD